MRKCLRPKVTTVILPEDLDLDDITTPGRADDAGIDMPGNASGTEAWLRRIGIITAGVLTIAACTTATAYCWTTGNENINEEAIEVTTVPETVASAGNGKSLVVYFSVPETDGVDAASGASRVLVDGKVAGNTQYVASIISEATGSDLFVKTERTYPGSHRALIEAAKEEHDSNARPKLATHISNLKDYDTVFVGFPNWWYDMPMPLYSFFDEYDFGGKTVIPFCTHGGSRFSSAIETIRTLEPKATVLDGHAISRDRVPESKESILKWLDKLGLKMID